MLINSMGLPERSRRRDVRERKLTAIYRSAIVRAFLHLWSEIYGINGCNRSHSFLSQYLDLLCALDRTRQPTDHYTKEGEQLRPADRRHVFSRGSHTEEWVQPYVPEVPRRPPKPDENYGEIIPEEEIEEEIENIKRQAEEFHAKDYGEEFLPPDATRLLARLGEPNDSKKPGVQRWKRLDWEHKKCTTEEIDIIQMHMLIKGKHTKVLTVLNVEGSISARDANGVHLGLRLLETIFTDGALPNLVSSTSDQ